MIYAFFLTNAVMLYYWLAVDHKVSGPAYALPPPSSGSRWPGRHGLGGPMGAPVSDDDDSKSQPRIKRRRSLPRHRAACTARAAGLDGLRIHDLRHTAVALWIAAGANPKEVSTRAGHASVSFTLDRYGHLYPEADTALRDRLDALYGTAQTAPASPVVRLPRRPGRGPSVAPRDPGNDESAADVLRRRSDLR
jgi:hypothetical protein